MLNYIKFSVKGSPTFIVNLLNNNSIGIKKLQITADKCIFYVHQSQYLALKSLMERHNKEYSERDNQSLSQYFRRNIKRIGIYIGIAISVVTMISYTQTVTRMDIKGNTLVGNEVIAEVLQKNMNFPCAKKSIDKLKVQNSLLKIDGIASASVFVTGNTVKVEVVEELPKVPIRQDSFEDIVSKYDSIVTKLITYSGASKVRVGDTVKKGQVIFGSQVPVDDKQFISEPTNGVAYGRVWISKTLLYEDTVTNLVRTGNSVTYYTCYGKKPKINLNFDKYEIETEKVYLNGVIPMPMTRTIAYELREQTEEFDFMRNLDGILKEQKRELEQNIPEGGTPLKFWHNYKRLDKSTQLVIYYEIECIIT